MNSDKARKKKGEQRIISLKDANGERNDPADMGGNGAPQTCTNKPLPDSSQAGELSDKEIRDIVESLLFSCATPLSASRINSLAGLGGEKKTENIIAELQRVFEAQGRPYFIQKLAGGYQLRTLPGFQPWVSKLQHKQHQDTLSQAALETLAIVAYRQPLTRAEIEDIRGVQSGYILRSLIEKSLVKVTGRSEELGRPLLYGTTGKFLEVFGLSSLKELPEIDNPEARG